MNSNLATHTLQETLRWLTPVLLVLGLPIVVALGAGRPALAHAAAAPPPKLLHFIELQVYGTEDASEDEPYLVVGGRKVWSGVVDYGNVATIVTVDLTHLAPIPFYDNIEVVLKEEDGPFDKDDFLGRNYIAASQAENRSHEVWFKEDGAKYKLVYRISTALASFICDGDPGVYLYEHVNYRGSCTKFVQSSRHIAWSEVGNDRASSVRIVGCFIAYLYEHGSYRGHWSKITANVPRLHGERVGNDRVTSLEVEPCR